MALTSPETTRPEKPPTYAQPIRRYALHRLIWITLLCFAAGGFAQQLRASKAPAPGRDASLTNVKIDLNTADAADFALLPGVGPVLANRIVAYRIEHGRFQSVDELHHVKGVGDRTLERVSPWVSVEIESSPAQ